MNSGNGFQDVEIDTKSKDGSVACSHSRLLDGAIRCDVPSSAQYVHVIAQLPGPDALADSFVGEEKNKAIRTQNFKAEHCEHRHLFKWKMAS